MAAAHVLIDGSVLEGGGQILRNSISLSALLGRSISVQKIRNARIPPGLRNQHRTGLELAAEICSARLTGATTGSVAIDFVPGPIQSQGNYQADSVTAGSTSLLLQIALPILLFSPRSVSTPLVLTLRGGTNASEAPQIDYTRHVFLPFMRRHFGLEGVELDLLRRGYYPKGGGEVRVSILPLHARAGREVNTGPEKCLEGIRLLERGRLKSVGGIAHFAGLPMAVGREMVMGSKRVLEESQVLGVANGENKVPVAIEFKRERDEVTKGAGSGIVLWAELEGGGIIGGSAVGRKGLKPFKVGEEAAEQLLKGLNAGGCVDEWLQDQVIIFMALARGESELKCGHGGLSLHTRTAIWVVQQLTDARFEVEEITSGHTVIRCRGIGYSSDCLAM